MDVESQLRGSINTYTSTFIGESRQHKNVWQQRNLKVCSSSSYLGLKITFKPWIVSFFSVLLSYVNTSCSFDRELYFFHGKENSGL